MRGKLPKLPVSTSVPLPPLASPCPHGLKHDKNPNDIHQSNKLVKLDINNFSEHTNYEPWVPSGTIRRHGHSRIAFIATEVSKSRLWTSPTTSSPGLCNLPIFQSGLVLCQLSKSGAGQQRDQNTSPGQSAPRMYMTTSSLTYFRGS